jgi:hypothetical protein
MSENLDVESLDRATADAIEVVRIIGVLTGHFALSDLATPLAAGENPIPALFQRLWTILERTGPVVEEADSILSVGAPGDTVDLEIEIPDKIYEAEWKAIFASGVPNHNAHAAALGLATQFFHAALWWLVGWLRPGLLRVPDTVPKPGTAKWKEMAEGFVRVWSRQVADCRMFPWLRNPSALLGRIQREHSSALRALQKAAEAGHPGTPVVFISSTIEDLKEYRFQAKEAANKAGFSPRMKEYFAASGDKPPLAKCLEKVSGSQAEQPANVLVVIVAHRYGWVPTDQPALDRKSITWLECEEARRKGCEVLAFVVDKDCSWPDNLREEHRLAKEAVTGTATTELLEEVQNNVARLAQFKAWIDTLGNRVTFTTPDSLFGEVLAALYQWRDRHPAFR